MAYTGVRLGAGQTAEFTPVASFPGLTAEVRARLGEMKVAPVSAEMVGETVMPEASREVATAGDGGAEDGCAKGGEARGSELEAGQSRHCEERRDEANPYLSFAEEWIASLRSQ